MGSPRCMQTTMRYNILTSVRVRCTIWFHRIDVCPPSQRTEYRISIADRYPFYSDSKRSVYYASYRSVSSMATIILSISSGSIVREGHRVINVSTIELPSMTMADIRPLALDLTPNMDQAPRSYLDWAPERLHGFSRQASRHGTSLLEI